MTSTERTDVGTVADLHASATKATGLSDFGSDDYREALAVLLESYRRDAELTAAGSKMHRYFLRGALIARLLSEQAWAQHPEYASVPIERPIFVTGLPRTGTTALHRLLTVDPSHQGLEMWLTEVPGPRPPRETWDANPVFAALERGFAQHHVDHPEFMGVHYMSAAEVEECWQLLRQSVQSIAYECLAYLPTYSSWLAQQSWLGAYRRHRRNLQLIGLHDTDRRWVLKNPSHLFALDELLQVYPDALVVQMHREPATIMPSMCSLAEQATAGWSEKFTGDVIGRTQLDLWERGLEVFAAARATADPTQFHDVDYHDFVADPLGTVESLYRHFGLRLTAEARTRMSTLHAESRSGNRRPAHRYALSDFGLDRREVERRLGAC
ncbi:sulfotransferase [Rhodococcus sp. BP-252]|uniref:sulfotransferase family protein n=1 Tax=unclassified Rhodococcus (in: high G+C Gram-positive bacteria) TaxID=192944 RepID=UPI00142F7975|nr:MULTISPECIES: sulfotransferase [unclassified Rhodococcus (in: high G+C Gram-positive bacteria)]MBY6413997.1 sulfotransferase [Rhodococcus sp. BP-320]MBY6418770.1 sulfotransferase [Rhodococcus sp. BP-321]MBY6423349.1 sulfotransferase [Rhodococcus sp. BP-324]MBY6428805.1 sulfotransferase [Rhodococcus sp. BP-323]MBY6433811.1 sulfotransferase [Rhodococcus sp. BP-322]